MTNAFGKSLLGASVLALTLAAAPAFAQTAPAPAQLDCTKQENAGKGNCPAGETVVVTGSRIRRDVFNQSAPLQIISVENTVLAGRTDSAKVLQNSTSAAGSNQINNFFSGFVVEGGPGIQTVGLNSLGAQQTLVMINGHRMPPSGTRGQVNAVDLQTLPDLALSRYEILNEGASPIYGSDAVGGVVNAITRKDVNGFEMNMQGSTSEAGGGNAFKIGGLWGKTADKWNAMISAQYTEQFALKIKDRNLCQQDYLFDPATGARVDFIDPATGTYYCTGVSGASFDRVTPTAGTAAAGTGTWVLDPTSTTRVVGTNPQTGAPNTLLKVPGYKRLFSPAIGTLGTPLAYQLNYKSKFIDESDIISPSQRTNVFGTFSHDLPVLDAKVYGEGLYSKRESQQTRGAQLFFVAPATNVYNPWGTSFGGTSGAQPVISRPANNEQTVEAWQLLGGIKGSTGRGIAGFMRNGNWDVYAQTSSSIGKYSGTTVLADRVNASLATTISGGVASCPTPVLSGGTCLPINFFDPRVITGNYTDAEYNYLFVADNEGKTVYEQSVFEANVSGDLFKIPGAADEVKANIGVQLREYSINDVPGKETLRGNVMLTTSSGITKGTDKVKEVFGEVVMPLVSKKPLIEDLSWTGAYRYTDYDSYDSNTTWKSTLAWRVTPQFQLVAISGTSYRAPALYELFLGNQTGFLSQASIDACINYELSSNTTLQARCAAEGIPTGYAGAGSSATIITGGGAGNLKEEESRSDIFSLIYSPTFADLRIRGDWWKIDVTDQIATFSAAGIVNACYTDLTGKASYFCSLFTRDGTFSIRQVDSTYVNINKTQVEGVDLKILYRKNFPFGRLTVDSQHRWTLHNETGLFSDSSLFDSAGTISEPAYTSSTQFRFVRKDWTTAWTVDAIGAASDVRFYGNDVLPIAAGSNYTFKGLTSLRYKMKTEATITHNLTVQYRNDNWTAVAGVVNLFDEGSPFVSSGIWTRLGNAPLNSQFDPVGRSFYFNLTRRF